MEFHSCRSSGGQVPGQFVEVQAIEALAVVPERWNRSFQESAACVRGRGVLQGCGCLMFQADVTASGFGRFRDTCRINGRFALQWCPHFLGSRPTDSISPAAFRQTVGKTPDAPASS